MVYFCSPFRFTHDALYCAFSMTLTTLALYQSSSWLFKACPCRPALEGLPPSLVQLSHNFSSYIRTFLCACGALYSAQLCLVSDEFVKVIHLFCIFPKVVLAIAKMKLFTCLDGKSSLPNIFGNVDPYVKIFIKSRPYELFVKCGVDLQFAYLSQYQSHPGNISFLLNSSYL